MATPVHKFQIGDSVWAATWDATEAWVECPDCCGHGRLRVIMGDGTEVSIDCQNCELGYQGPQGRKLYYARAARAELCVIKGVRIEGDHVEYQSSRSYTELEVNLFDNEADALARAQMIASEEETKERNRIFQKEKDTRSWAWNATYHRRAIRDAKKAIDYHTRKLAVASLKAKEAKKEPAGEAA